MTKLFAVGLAGFVALSSSSSAITFPSLTTIYVGAGITDAGLAATSFQCTNVSGQTASLRILILDDQAMVLDSTTVPLQHGRGHAISTRNIALFGNETDMATGSVSQGTVNIESTQSGVFCTAMLIDATASAPNGIDIHLVRVNPHPGTVE